LGLRQEKRKEPKSVERRANLEGKSTVMIGDFRTALTELEEKSDG
jgi:hypothetical protein